MNESTTTDKKEVLITRTVDAPRELVFRAWTDPKHLRRWFAPEGCEVEFLRVDVREGGSYHSVIRPPNHHDCWCIGTYFEVVEPERLVFSMVAADGQGNAVEPAEVGMDPDWPRETRVTVTFEEQGGKTSITLHQTVSETLAKRTGAYPSWLSMFDRLETLVSDAA